ncbi:ABC transporter permease [Pyrococcus sp. ST04]|uniref:ABC transporter permease n=1 Tax=Pyrococcus sp. ST04 TaxID=1183377 RepID=UPI0002605DAE|nr:ABC transporter permease [Pyrococcus sp. ST04]AFK22509.1 ABC-type multidrug transport system permease [Pyrococcus sp. ST04]
MGSLVRFLYLAKASLLTAKRYKIDWYGNVLMPILGVLPVIIAVWYGNRIGFLDFSDVVGTEKFFEYYILGVTYWNYVEAVWASIFMLREHMRIGQLEELLLTPVKPWEYILGWSFLAIILTTVSSMPLILIAIAVNIFHTSIKAYILATFIFLISMIASFGFAFLIFGLTLVIREGDEIVSLLGNAAPLLGGLYFPVTLLPTPLLIISYVFPFTWGVDLLRTVFLGSKTILSFETELILLFIMSLGYFGMGILSYKLLEIKMRRKGIQGF